MSGTLNCARPVNAACCCGFSCIRSIPLTFNTGSAVTSAVVAANVARSLVTDTGVVVRCEAIRTGVAGDMVSAIGKLEAL